MLLISLSTTSFSSYSTNRLYTTVDQYGHKIFSDRKPQPDDFETRKQVEIKPVIWKKAPILKIENIIKLKKIKYSKPAISKKQRCQKLLAQMLSLEKQLQY